MFSKLNDLFSAKRVAPSPIEEIAEEQREPLLSSEERDLNTQAGAKNTTTSDSSAQKLSTYSKFTLSFTSPFKKAVDAASASTKAKKPEDVLNPSQETKDVYPSQETRHALYSACNSGDLKACMELIGNKADVNTDLLAGETPLMLASQQGHGHIVEFLIEAGANINAVDIHGETALFKSCVTLYHGVTFKLIAAGADVNLRNSRGETPLFHASLIDNVEIVQKLIREGAHLDLTTNYGQSPLHIASQKGNKDTVAILLNAGANVDLVNPYTKETPLHLVCDRKVYVELGNPQIEDMATKERKNLLETAKILIANSANLNAVDSKGETALHFACKNGDTEIAKLLLKEGADVNAKRNDGMSPVFMACLHNNAKTAAILFEAGANSGCLEEAKLRHYVVVGGLPSSNEETDAIIKKITDKAEIARRDADLIALNQSRSSRGVNIAGVQPSSRSYAASAVEISSTPTTQRSP